MNMPGFSAEASLYRRTDGHRASININQRSRNVSPAQLWSDVVTDVPPPRLAQPWVQAVGPHQCWGYEQYYDGEFGPYYRLVWLC